MNISKKDLLEKRKTLLVQLEKTQRQLYNIEGAVMFIDIELKKMNEEEVNDGGEGPRTD